MSRRRRIAILCLIAVTGWCIGALFGALFPRLFGA